MDVLCLPTLVFTVVVGWIAINTKELAAYFVSIGVKSRIPSCYTAFREISGELAVFTEIFAALLISVVVVGRAIGGIAVWVSRGFAI